MKLSASFLSIKENLKENIRKLGNSNIDYLHLDIMDNLFVPNITWSFDQITDLLKGIEKPKDVHLMVKDVIKYIDEYCLLKPIYITFHLEAVDNVLEVIKYIKSKNIKVGISIKPNTKVEELEIYLKFIDLVLVMSVEPGFGGQAFIDDIMNKISILNQLRIDNNYSYLIEVDGGIDNKKVQELKNNSVDIVVVGSYITDDNNYAEQINKLNLK